MARTISRRKLAFLVGAVALVSYKMAPICKTLTAAVDGAAKCPGLGNPYRLITAGEQMSFIHNVQHHATGFRPIKVEHETAVTGGNCQCVVSRARPWLLQSRTGWQPVDM